MIDLERPDTPRKGVRAASPHVAWSWLLAGVLLAAMLAMGCGGGAGAPVTEQFDPSAVVVGTREMPPEDTADVGMAGDPIPPDQLPSSVDLTASMAPVDSKGLVDVTARAMGIFPPIGNQGSQGSCTAWATGYCLASYMAARSLEWSSLSTTNHQASPSFLYPRAGAKWRAYAGSWTCGDGTSIYHALQVLQEVGCSSLAVVPYDVTGSSGGCNENNPTTDAATFKIDSFSAVAYGTRTSVQSQLAAGNPVVFGATVYSNFMSWTGSNVYSAPSGSSLGGHAMVVVGYDNAKSAYRVQNSWGTGWGDAGYIWMGYSAFESTTNTAFVAARSDTPPPQNEAPVITAMTAAPATVAPLVRATVSLVASDPNGDALSYVWSCSGGTLGTGSQSVSWTAPAQNGTYTVSCTVRDPAGLTATRSVNVVVTSPTGGEVIVIQGGAA